MISSKHHLKKLVFLFIHNPLSLTIRGNKQEFLVHHKMLFMILQGNLICQQAQQNTQNGHLQFYFLSQFCDYKVKIIIEMMRILLKTSMFFARRVKKGKQITAEEEISDEVQPLKSRNIQSEYQQIKQMFQSMQKDEVKQQSDDKNLDLSIDFLQKMIKEDKKSTQTIAKEKSKITLQEKLRKLGTPEQLIKKKQIKSHQQNRQTLKIKDQKINVEFQKNELVETIISQSGINTEQLEKKMNNQLKLAQQQLMLQEIMKKSKEKQVKLDIIQQKNPESEREYQKRLILRRQKIIESFQQKADPSEAKLELTTQDLLSMKYSPQILAKAHQYNNHQLRYFKQLINNEDAQNNRNSRLNKRHYRDENDERKYLEEQSKYDQVPQPVLENSYKTLKQEEGLKVFQDQNFYMKKAMRQIKEKAVLTPQDLKLKQQLQKDLEFGQKISDVFLDEVVFPNQAKVQRRIAYDDTSFAKQDNQIRQLNKRMANLGLDFNQEQIKSLSTQLLFEQKHFLQQQQGFQKYLQRKQKKKNMKTQLREIHKNVLKDDLDFDKEEQAVMSVKEIRESSDTALLEDNFQKLQEYQARKQAVLVDQTPQEKQSQIHRKKTFKNMQNFLTLYFANGLLNHNSNQLKVIELLQIIPNKSNTVMNIFWNIESQYLQSKGIISGSNNYAQNFEKQKKKLQNRLKNQSNYISGKMTQLLRLRYGPEIRFYFDEKTKKTTDAIQQLSKYTKQIAMVELEEYQKKGLIKNQQQEVEYYEKLLNVAKGKLDQFNSRKQLLSKKYQKLHRIQEPTPISSKSNVTNDTLDKTKKKRINPILQKQPLQLNQKKTGSAEAHRKKKPSDKLWDAIDLL